MDWKKATQEQRDQKNQRRREWRAKQGVKVGGAHDGSKSAKARAHILAHKDMSIVAVSRKIGVSYGLVWRVYTKLVSEGLVASKRASRK